MSLHVLPLNFILLHILSSFKSLWNAFQPFLYISRRGKIVVFNLFYLETSMTSFKYYFIFGKYEQTNTSEYTSIQFCIS